MDIFQALAEPSRRNIIELLAKKGKLSSTDISNQFQISAPAISQHLKVLREADLLVMEKQAQKRLYKINPEKMQELGKWIKKLTQLWDKRFLALDKVLEGNKKKGGGK
jgi:DNA-binding transcriptional ArsR family regulator